jgi:long-chain acyl-CoA synthetase
VGIIVADPPPTRAQLIAHLRPLVDDYKIPREFFHASRLPMTNSGKTDFAAVRSLFQAGECIAL